MMNIDFFVSYDTFWEFSIKLILTAVLSLIIGLERELKKKPVGLKTSLVIAIFSCLLTIISIETAYATPPRPEINITMDPLRLAAQVVSGIGFLGAGVILRRGNDSITGLTTAAMIWGAAGIGIGIGAGFYVQVILSVAIVMIGIELIAPFLLHVGPKRLRMQEVDITFYLKEKAFIQDVLQFMQQNKMEIEKVKISDTYNATNQVIQKVQVRFSTDRQMTALTLYESFGKLDCIDRIEIELIR